MRAIIVVCLVMSALCILFGLLLSKSGTTSGIVTLSAQDMEIFKKTKDRGWIKIYQISMIICAFCLLIIAIVMKYTVK